MENIYNPYNLEAEFKDYLELNNFSRSSIHNYLTDIRKFLSWYTVMLQKQGLSYDIKHLNKEAIILYKQHLIAENTPVKSVNRAFSSLRTLSKFLLNRGILMNNPFDSVNNIKVDTLTSLYIFSIRNRKSLLLFILGFFIVLILFAIPLVFIFQSNRIGKQIFGMPTDNLTEGTVSLQNRVASTSADLMTVPIIDQQGVLNLSAPYPKIKGQSGTLTIEGPQLALRSLGEGFLLFETDEGSMQFLFNGSKPSLPFESAFYFAGKNLSTGTLIQAQTESESNRIRLLELLSGIPADTKFSVDAEGNVYIKGNIVLDGNLIVNPKSQIFGNLVTESATSSFSPEP